MGRTAGGIDTRTRLLDAGERMFADRGYEGTALRAIIREAGVNLAAVHYHFGSKEALFLAIVERMFAPMNAERLARLDALEAAEGLPTIEQVLEAFFAPAMEIIGQGVEAHRFCGRIHAALPDHLQAKIWEMFIKVADRFGAAHRKALPELPPADFFWRAHFMLGAMIHAVTDDFGLKRLSGGLCCCDANDPAAVTRQLVAFTAAGFRAPAVTCFPDSACSATSDCCPSTGDGRGQTNP